MDLKDRPINNSRRPISQIKLHCSKSFKFQGQRFTYFFFIIEYNYKIKRKL